MNEHNILAAILAGGKSRRMGKDKLFIDLNNKPMLQYTTDKLKKILPKKLLIVTNQNNKFFLKEVIN